MKKLVEFIMLGKDKPEFSQNEYASCVFGHIHAMGFVTTVKELYSTAYSRAALKASYLTDYLERPYQQELERIHFLYSYYIDNKDVDFEITMEYGSYQSNYQCTVEIYSDEYDLDRYAGKKEESYLEKLKFTIKEYMISNWEKVLWVYDKESEIMSSILHGKIYDIENDLRRFIYDVVQKNYGFHGYDTLISHIISESNLNKRRENVYDDPKYSKIEDKTMGLFLSELVEKLTEIMVNPGTSVGSSHAAAPQPSHAGNAANQVENGGSASGTNNVSYWEACFEDICADDFLEKCTKCRRSRNVVAHNRLLTHAAYSDYREKFADFEMSLHEAKAAFEEKFTSEERKALEYSPEELKTGEMNFEYALNEIEYDIETFDKDVILEKLMNGLSEVYDAAEDQVREFENAEITSMEDLTPDDYSGILFSITKGNHIMNVEYELNIFDNPGDVSTLELQITDDTDETYRWGISYENGDAQDEINMVRGNLRYVEQTSKDLADYIQKQLKDW